MRIRICIEATFVDEVPPALEDRIDALMEYLCEASVDPTISLEPAVDE